MDERSGRDPYDDAIDRVFQATLVREAEVAREQSRARDLFHELCRHPLPRQLLLVANSSRLQSRALAEVILEEAQSAVFSDPGLSKAQAHLAVAIAEGLVGAGAEGIEGLRTRAWAQLGNACRILSDHSGATKAFEVAMAQLESAEVAPLETARVLDLYASLMRDQRRFEEAFDLLDRALAIHRKLGQSALLGRSLKQKAMICGESGDLEGEIALLREALELLSPEDEPITFLSARHNLISALCEAGHPRDAFALLFHTRPLYLKQGERLNLLRLRWLEGTVALGLDRHEQAAVAFREVRQSFLELSLDYDAALASLDLAQVYALQGRSSEVRWLVDEMLDTFRSRDIHREALAALSVLQQAVQAEKAGAMFVRQVGLFLRKARTRPDLSFEPSPHLP